MSSEYLTRRRFDLTVAVHSEVVVMDFRVVDVSVNVHIVEDIDVASIDAESADLWRNTTSAISFTPWRDEHALEAKQSSGKYCVSPLDEELQSILYSGMASGLIHAQTTPAACLVTQWVF